MKKIVKNKNLVSLVVASALLSGQIAPAMAWKIKLPDVINTGVQIYNQTKKSDGRVKTPKNFSPKRLVFKSKTDINSNLPAGDYFLLMPPRTDVQLQAGETPWFAINPHAIGHVVVDGQGNRRLEIRITGNHQKQLKDLKLSQAQPKLPAPSVPRPANDNFPGRIPANDNIFVPSEELTVEKIEGTALKFLWNVIARNPFVNQQF